MALGNDGGADGGAGGDGGQGGGASAAELFGGGAGGDGGQGGGEGQQDGGTGGQGGGEIQGGADPDFFQHVSAEVPEGGTSSLRDWLKAAGVKDINGLAQIARDNQAALRDSGRIKVPGADAKPEEIAAFHKSIGVPDDAKGYEIAAPNDADGNPVPLDTALLDRLAAVAHKAGIPKAAYEALVGDFVAMQMEELGLSNAAEQAEAQAKVKEWGQNSTAKMAAVQSAMEALGLSRDEGLKLRGALGAGRAMDLLSKLGEGIAEDTMLTGGGSGKFGISGAQAQDQINALIKDPKTADLVRVPGSPENERFKRLQDIVGRDADRKAAALL